MASFGRAAPRDQSRVAGYRNGARITGHNSPLIGPKQLIALKVADLDTLQFPTVYADLDPSTNLGYGNRY